MLIAIAVAIMITLSVAVGALWAPPAHAAFALDAIGDLTSKLIKVMQRHRRRQARAARRDAQTDDDEDQDDEDQDDGEGMRTRNSRTGVNPLGGRIC